MSTQTSGQKRAELKVLAKRCKSTIFDMLKLADELLSDHEYVGDYGGEDKLMDDMQADEFSHFGSKPTLSQMIRAYRANPKRATWDEYKSDIWAMIDLAQPGNPNDSDIVRINWKARCKEAEAKVAQLEAVVDDQRKTIAAQQSQIDQLRAELGEFKGRLAERRERTHG